MYKITTSYNWYIAEGEKYLIKSFLINRIPYTFDEIEPHQMTNDMINQANLNKKYTTEEMYNYCDYLIMELAHPLLFDLDDLEVICE